MAIVILITSSLQARAKGNIRIGIIIGAFMSLVAFGELSYALFVKIFTVKVVPGWTSAISIVSLLFGILFILLGLLGEYIGKILIEVRWRPRYLIRERIGIKGAINQDFYH